MFVPVGFTPAARKDTLLVPSEAVIQTGKRSVVIVANGDGKFAPVEVEIGAESCGQDGDPPGIDGGAAGRGVGTVPDRFRSEPQAEVVADGRRRNVDRRDGRDGTECIESACIRCRGTPRHGKVEAIDKDGITLSHGPIPSLKWKAMTMRFRPSPRRIRTDVTVGDMVTFETVPRPTGTTRSRRCARRFVAT